MIEYAHNWGLERVPSRLFVSAHVEERSISGYGEEDAHAVFVGYRKTYRSTDEILSPREGLIGTWRSGPAYRASAAAASLARADFSTGWCRSGSATTCCCARNWALSWPPRAPEFHRRLFSAPAETRACEATPTTPSAFR